MHKSKRTAEVNTQKHNELRLFKCIAEHLVNFDSIRVKNAVTELTRGTVRKTAKLISLKRGSA